MHAFDILGVNSRQVFDSRGVPTIETAVKTTRGVFRAMVPSGKSTGRHEAHELRDGGKHFHGKGVMHAVKNVNEKIASKLRGQDARKQQAIDNFLIALDGTANKEELGANAILSVSLAVAKAAAVAEHKPLYLYLSELCENKKLLLPVPFFNLINGGEHAANKLDFQEHLLVPYKAKSFEEAMQIGSEVYWELDKLIAKKYGKHSTNTGDEGGFDPGMKHVTEPLKLIMAAVEELGYENKVGLALDVAASTFYSKNKYFVDGKHLAPDKLIDLYDGLLNHYPIVSIEDAFAEDDWLSWIAFTAGYGKELQILGDDLLCTNLARIRKASILNACNSLLLKLNQIGTLTEAIRAGNFALENYWNVMVSHRSGETEDSFIADLSVALGAGQIKAGAPCKSERLAKYNQLIRIEDWLGKKAKYAGKNCFRHQKIR